MAHDRGLDVDGHRSRRLDRARADAATWLIGMTGEHVRGIHAALPQYTGRVAKLGRPGVALGPDDDVGPGEDVDDPWRKGTELAYELMAEQVDRLLAAWDDVFAEEAR
jgi:protein-tyrosine-phosphatase